MLDCSIFVAITEILNRSAGFYIGEKRYLDLDAVAHGVFQHNGVQKELNNIYTLLNKSTLLKQELADGVHYNGIWT